MKKIFPIIIGIIIGVGLGIGGELNSQANSVWEETVAFGDLFEWQDVFGAIGLSEDERGKDLYNLVYNKLLVRPDDESFKAVAQKYGLTKQEAEDVANGSLATIYHSSHLKGGSQIDGDLTQAEAIALSQKIITDLNNYKELFELQQEIDTAIAQSELFANGDVADSGFDLIYDLSVIEQILFLSNTPVDVGDTYENAMDSPVTENKNPPIYTSPDGGVDGVDISDDGLTASIDIGPDKSVTADVLEEDVCTTEEPLLEALGEFESSLPPEEESEAEEVDASEEDQALSQDDFPAAASGNWGSVFCPEFNDPKDRDPNPPLESMGLGASQEGDADEGDTSFTISIPICLTIELIKDKASSYQTSSDQCVNCEVKKINELFEKTLTHSLVPNKVTGNYLESAKCKQTFEVPLVDIKVLPIPSPVLTPPKDDLIYENNIFEEWNDFVGRLGWDELTAEQQYIEDFELGVLPEDFSNINAIAELSYEKTKARNEALLEMQDIGTALSGGQNSVYSSALLPEMRQMTIYFERYKKVFEDIGEVCKAITSKPNIQ